MVFRPRRFARGYRCSDAPPTGEPRIRRRTGCADHLFVRARWKIGLHGRRHRAGGGQAHCSARYCYVAGVARRRASSRRRAASASTQFVLRCRLDRRGLTSLHSRPFHAILMWAPRFSQRIDHAGATAGTCDMEVTSAFTDRRCKADGLKSAPNETRSRPSLSTSHIISRPLSHPGSSPMASIFAKKGERRALGVFQRPHRESGDVDAERTGFQRGTSERTDCRPSCVLPPRPPRGEQISNLVIYFVYKRTVLM